MLSIDDLVHHNGLRCPNCKGDVVRAGYHDWQNMDSFICEKCGYRWREDHDELERVRYDKQRFLWVMVDSSQPLCPLLNPASSDEGGTRDAFVKKGLRRVRVGNSVSSSEGS